MFAAAVIFRSDDFTPYFHFRCSSLATFDRYFDLSCGVGGICARTRLKTLSGLLSGRFSLGIIQV